MFFTGIVHISLTVHVLQFKYSQTCWWSHKLALEVASGVAHVPPTRTSSAQSHVQMPSICGSDWLFADIWNHRVPHTNWQRSFRRSSVKTKTVLLVTRQATRTLFHKRHLSEIKHIYLRIFQEWIDSNIDCNNFSVSVYECYKCFSSQNSTRATSENFDYFIWWLIQRRSL